LSSSILYLHLLKTYEISLVSPMINLSPIVLLVLSSVILSESITFVQFLGIIIVIVFAFILEVTAHGSKKRPIKQHFIKLKRILKKEKIESEIYSFFHFRSKRTKFIYHVFIMLVFFSISGVTDKLILKDVNALTNLFFTALFVSFFILIYIFKTKDLIDIIVLFKKKEVFFVSLLNLSSNILILYAISIPSALVSLVIPVRRTSTLFSSFFGGLLFHEKHLRKKLISVIGMIFGVLLIAF